MVLSTGNYTYPTNVRILFNQDKEPLMEQIRCNCTMEFQSTENDNHDDSCALWHERTFWDGDDYWDGETETLRIAPLGMNPRTSVEFPYSDKADSWTPVSPWDEADKWVWDGDTPVCRIETQKAREAAKQDTTDDWDICDQEDEVNAALISGVEPDEFGWVKLPDGSWADVENRVTYRLIKDDEGHDCWVEELWDEADTPPRATKADNNDDARCSCNPEKKYWCTPCGVTRDTSDEPWRWCTSQDWKDYDNGWDYWSNTCTHALDPIQLKDVVIYASKNRRHTPDTTPDLGVYAYSGWNPDSAAIFIPWTDFGLPTINFSKVAELLKSAFDAAKSGQVVEFGCMGGHGRTGTMLACMAILADPTLTGPEAVKYVRAAHCTKAVETASQEWFVRWFRAWVLDERFTEPQPSSYSSSGGGANKTLVSTTYEDGKTVKKYSDGTTTTLWDGGGSITNYGGSVTGTPKGGSATLPTFGEGAPSPKWCSGCHRAVYTYHNSDCPFDWDNQNIPVTSPVPVFQPERRDGNVAPGATANARRKADRRKARQSAAKRAKQRRAEQYRNQAQTGRR